jgi:hypothetical protein
MNELLKLGYKDVIVKAATTDRASKIRSISYSHYSVVKDNESRVPFIVFEEDAMPLNYVDSVSIPDDADALYLGLLSAPSFLDPVLEAIAGFPGVYRVEKLLGAHAILYLSNRYASAAKMAFARSSQGILGYEDADMALSDINKNFNVYAINPVFCQHNPNNPFLSNLSRINSLATMNRDIIL